MVHLLTNMGTPLSEETLIQNHKKSDASYCLGAVGGDQSGTALDFEIRPERGSA